MSASRGSFLTMFRIHTRHRPVLVFAGTTSGLGFRIMTKTYTCTGFGVKAIARFRVIVRNNRRLQGSLFLQVRCLDLFFDLLYKLLLLCFKESRIDLDLLVHIDNFLSIDILGYIFRIEFLELLFPPLYPCLLRYLRSTSYRLVNTKF